MGEAKPYPKSVQVPQRKKYRRVVASAKKWAALREERLGPCVLCAVTDDVQDTPSELHHCVPRDRFGDDVSENLIPLCRVHHNAVEQGYNGALNVLATVIQRDEPAVYAYMVDKLGEDGFLRLMKVRFECSVDESGGLA